MAKYLTSPEVTDKMPGGVPYIVGNEAAERFSYYGMKAILVIFMTKYLLDSSGAFAPMSEEEAKVVYHTFTSASYFLPVLGAIVADAFLGKYRTIIFLSIVYCLGHFALALDETKTGLYLGLGLIAIGAGGIKPCVQAHVGDQFGQKNKHLIEKVFMWFYFSINFGSFFSTLWIPSLLQNYGPKVAFGVPGIFMLLATLVFWMGRNKFAHIPPGGTKFLKEIFSREGLSVIARLMTVYIFVTMFFSLFDQTGSAWVLQAEKMNRNLFGVELLSSQIQAINPILVLVFIPIFQRFLYPMISRVWPLNPLRKIGLGLFLAVASFLLPAWVEVLIGQGQTPSIGWHVLAYVIITAAEVMITITCYEFSYTQAPNKMKSFVMSLFLVIIALGNLFTAVVNSFIQNADGSSKLSGPDYYLFFSAVMLFTAICYVPVAMKYREKVYIQE